MAHRRLNEPIALFGDGMLAYFPTDCVIAVNSLPTPVCRDCVRDDVVKAMESVVIHVHLV